MAQPQPYNRSIDFTDRDGDDTDHAGLNAELDAAATSINQLRTNIKQIQRDDGQLANESVGADQLAPGAFDALQVSVNAAVQDAQDAAQSALTSATTAQTAATEAGGYRAGIDAALTAAQLNAQDAAASAVSAAGSAATATTQAGTATTQAGIATTQASAAASSASAAAGSATTATTKAGEASASASAAAGSATTASTQAGIATTQAGTATTQAGIATTQAGIATTKAGEAASSAAAAAASAASIDTTLLVKRDGSNSMTGALTLSGNATDDLHAVPKQQLDSVAARLPVGAIMPFARTTAPAGWLKLNGAAISVSAYADLTAAIYCGDSENATATWGYRCTDPGNAAGTRNTTGNYIVLLDARGEAIRGLDDGRGVDVGRTLWSYQLDAMQGHYHSTQSYQRVAAGASYGSTASGASAGSGTLGPISDGTNGEPRIAAETRMRNFAALICIKY